MSSVTGAARRPLTTGRMYIVGSRASLNAPDHNTSLTPYNRSDIEDIRMAGEADHFQIKWGSGAILYGGHNLP